MSGKIYHPETKHPGTAQQDLSPDAHKGLNHGMDGPPIPTRTAAELRDVHNMLAGDFTVDELKQIPVLSPGVRLETKAAYINLIDGERKEFHALGNEEVGPNDLYIAKKDVPYELWNKLLGIRDPSRTLEKR